MADRDTPRNAGGSSTGIADAGSDMIPLRMGWTRPRAAPTSPPKKSTCTNNVQPVSVVLPVRRGKLYRSLGNNARQKHQSRARESVPIHRNSQGAETEGSALQCPSRLTAIAQHRSPGSPPVPQVQRTKPTLAP